MPEGLAVKNSYPQTISFSFLWSGRRYLARLLPAKEPGEGDALVFGASLRPPVRIVTRRDDGSWTFPTGEPLTPLARAAVAAIP